MCIVGRLFLGVLNSSQIQPGEFCTYAERTNDYRRDRYGDRDGPS
jgi:hypothetical protein